jgi:hypothetical protein
MSTVRRPRSLDELKSMDPKPGDAAFLLADPTTRFMVVGTLPSDQVEVVSLDQIERRTNNWRDYDDILDAVNRSRLVTYYLHTDKIAPLLKAMIDNNGGKADG